MNFYVKQTNTSITASNLFDERNSYVDFPHGIIVLSALVVLPIVNSIRNANSSPLRPDNWSQLPLLARPSVYVIIGTILLPLLAVPVGVLLAYKTTVSAWLRFWHKDKFKGILSGPDSLWTLEDASSSVINILLVVRHKSGSQCARQAIKKLKKLTDDPALWKLQCRLETCMGYTYLLMKEHGACVRQLCAGCYANREILQNTLSELASADIADGKLWEAYVGVEEIAWGGKTHCYPLIVRFHHALGDGLVLLQLVQRCLTSATDGRLEIHVDARDAHMQEHGSDKDVMQTMVKITIRLMHSALLFYKFPQSILQFLSRTPDANVLHDSGPRAALTGEKIVAWKVEKGYKYVNRVKRIKRQLAGAAFLDVIASSISYSLNKFFKHNNERISYVNVIIPAVPHAANLVNTNMSQNCPLTNRFSVAVSKLPVDVKHLDDKERCYWRCAQSIANLYELRRGFEFQLNYWLINIVIGVMPRNIALRLLRQSLRQSTLIISNLPGPRRVLLHDMGDIDWKESFVEDIVFWIPQRGLTGVSFSVFTYDGRFQLGLAIDKVFGVTQSEADGMLESIFDYIDRLHDELCENI